MENPHEPPGSISHGVSYYIQSRRFRCAGHIIRMEEGTSVFKILTGKPTGKRPLGRTILNGP